MSHSSLSSGHLKSMASADESAGAHDTATPSLSADMASTHGPSTIHSTRFHPTRSGRRSTQTPAASRSRSPAAASSSSSRSSGSSSDPDSDTPPLTAAPNPVPFSANGTGTSRGKSSKHPQSSNFAPPATIGAKIGPGQLNATLPQRGFFQCEPAIINITTEANQPVAVTVFDYHNVFQRLDVTIPPPVTLWNWTAVDFPAGTELRVELAVGGEDVNSPQWASWVEMSHVHLGGNVTDCLDASDIGSTAAPAHDRNRHLGTILGAVIPLVLAACIVGALIGCIFLRRKRERKDRAALAADPDTRLRDWQDRASMMWENSSRGLMRHMASPDAGRRAVSLDSSTNLASGLGPHVSVAESPFDDANYASAQGTMPEDHLPTYKQSQRESRRLALPSYTRASTFTRATPTNLNRPTTALSSIHLGPLALSTAATERDEQGATEPLAPSRHQADLAITPPDTNFQRASDVRRTRASLAGSSSLCLSAFEETSGPSRPHT